MFVTEQLSITEFRTHTACVCLVTEERGIFFIFANAVAFPSCGAVRALSQFVAKNNGSNFHLNENPMNSGVVVVGGKL